jgi:hypothetical protein
MRENNTKSDSSMGETTRDDNDDKMISLEDFIQRVMRACKPDAPTGFVEQMRTATRGMATQANLHPALQELGRILTAVLAGERNPDLSELPNNVAARIKEMLHEL